VLLPVFEPGKSNCVVTCAPIMQENMEKTFKEMGYKTQIRTLTDFYDDYGLEGGEDDGEEDDEDEDEDEDMSDGDEGSTDGEGSHSEDEMKE